MRERRTLKHIITDANERRDDAAKLSSKALEARIAAGHAEVALMRSLAESGPVVEWVSDKTSITYLTRKQLRDILAKATSDVVVIQARSAYVATVPVDIVAGDEEEATVEIGPETDGDPNVVDLTSWDLPHDGDGRTLGGKAPNGNGVPKPGDIVTFADEMVRVMGEG